MLGLKEDFEVFCGKKGGGFEDNVLAAFMKLERVWTIEKELDFDAEFEKGKQVEV